MPTATPRFVVPPTTSTKRWLLGSNDDPRGVRGAVVVEFAVAVMPLLVLFFTFVQAAFPYTANLALRHAANTGARAAAVILPPNPGNVGTPADVDKSVEVALGGWSTSFDTMTITQTPPTVRTSSSRKIFGESGPKGMFRYAENGNDLLQVWAFTRGEMDDNDARKVAVAGKAYGATTPHHANWYVAQAEMYFDCNGAWGDGACNANDNAIYNMRWRARVRRVRKPDFGDELGTFLKSAIIDGKVKDLVKEGAGLNDIAGEGAGLGELAAEGAASAIFDTIWGELTSDIPLPQDDQTPYEGSKWFH